jgi:hypothetical protein
MTCHYQEDHPNQCTSAVKPYPWHDIDGFILEKRGTPNIPIHTYFTEEVYDLSKKYLANGKALGPDKIPNAILKHLTSQFHDLLYYFFLQC